MSTSSSSISFSTSFLSSMTVSYHVFTASASVPLTKSQQVCILVHMAKRATGVGNNKTSRSKKTKKRLAIKKEMLAQRASKKRK
jgi:hypothetical protein